MYRFVVTPIFNPVLKDALVGQFQAQGVDFANEEDAADAVMRIVTDQSVNGEQYHQFYSSTKTYTAEGRTIGIVPRQLSPSGYMDLVLDDFQENSPCDKLQKVASSLKYPGINKD